MKSRLLALIGSAVLLVGCSQSDIGITTAVKNRLATDDLVQARVIDVTTRDRVVTLTGQVGTVDEQARAVEIARNTNGVSDVVDQLIVNPAPEATTGTLPNTPIGGDAGITAEVKAKLLADPDISGLAVNVDTRASVVTLTGSVSSAAEKAEAVRLAREVSGVTNVVDQLVVQAP